MNEALKARGAVAEFCRKTEFARNTADSWLDGVSAPNVNNLDSIAEGIRAVTGIKTTAWELLKPDQQGNKETEAARIAKVVASLDDEKNANVLESVKALLAGFSIHVPPKSEGSSQSQSKGA